MSSRMTNHLIISSARHRSPLFHRGKTQCADSLQHKLNTGHNIIIRYSYGKLPGKRRGPMLSKLTATHPAKKSSQKYCNLYIPRGEELPLCIGGFTGYIPVDKGE